MTNHPNLPQTLRKNLLTPLEDDIRAHSKANEEIHAHLRGEHQRAKDADRTALEFGAWRDEQVTLSAVQWILACVFVRFCEDTGLISEPRLAGEGERLRLAEDATTNYFRQNPSDSDREYLLWVFEQSGALPGMAALFDPDHNPLYKLPPSVDGADRLLSYWRGLDPETGELALSFADPDRDTRFLGDLYQDLSEDAKKRYALLQTPEFIESFILDRTLEPAIGEFGLANTDLIDPACGSGHFLLGAFERLLVHWREKEPQTSVRALCQRSLDQIAGVDINPFAVAIAEFRLLVAALNASEVSELKDAPDFKLNLATGDSLLHGQRPGQFPGMERASARAEHQHLYEVEEEALLRKILDHRYAAVVANPPYITPKDPAANQAYRDRFSSCHRVYALSVPFVERLFDLARPSDGRTPAGFIGQITSNSFMKREFGTKLVEEYLPNWDLTHLVDTSGAYIPGHGTPTVVLFARGQAPRSEQVRGVLGIRGEPSTPDDPAQGKVWSEITALIDQPGAEGEFVSIEELERATLAKHPWSLQGGGALEVLRSLRGNPLEQHFDMGVLARASADDVFIRPRGAFRRAGTSVNVVRALLGEEVRDWAIAPTLEAWFPYEDGELLERDVEVDGEPTLWRYRALLERRTAFGNQSYQQAGRAWWSWHQVTARFDTAPVVPLAFIATHNHFARSGARLIYNRSAPVITTRDSATADLFEVQGACNSSIALFWARQNMFPKGGYGGGHWENRLEWDATKLQRFPLPKDPPTELARRLDALAQELGKTVPSALLEENDPSKELLAEGKSRWISLRKQMIALQEELDWRCYHLYGLIDEDLVYSDWDQLPEVDLGERPFEIALTRRVEAGETETRWFERHGSESVSEIPSHFPDDYRDLFQRRLDAIDDNKSIRLIERPEYKRRWAADNAGKGRGWKVEGWEAMEQQALREWICDRLESDQIWSEPPTLFRADQVSDKLLGDTAFQEALRLYAGTDVDPGKLVAKLMAEESVPYLASLRYKPSGIRKREAWERTWELQRAEDRGEKVEIDVPPKYKSSDFKKSSYWKHRGKLDVPKERFTSYPGAGSDGSDLYGWAGWDHAQRAQALASRITFAHDQEGQSQELLVQMLAGLEELLPWVRQWHPDVDPRYGQALGDIYEAFVEDRAGRLGVLRGELGATTSSSNGSLAL